MGRWRNDKPSIVFEPDEAAVKEVVNARRQEQPVLAVHNPTLIKIIEVISKIDTVH
jgi:hypothetical protein